MQFSDAAAVTCVVMSALFHVKAHLPKPVTGCFPHKETDQH